MSLNFKISSIFEYTAHWLKKYNRLHQSNNNIYRIIEIKHLPKNQFKLLIQVIGKSFAIESTPEEIMATDHILEGFSKKDIRTITYLACHVIKKTKYKILTQEFCEQLNTMTFKIKELKNEKSFVKTAREIVMDKELVNSLSREDVSSISYIAGYELSQNGNHLK